ncbi:MAG TPA: hypothetical protein VG276_22855 [Actinomycetes bacterium]|jgi:hypothetical protein|nr:hypothetical protein [Actinomycetes bacterium]
MTLFLAVKALLRKLRILRPFPKDEVHYASQRQKELVGQIRKAHGLAAANQAMDEIDAMMARVAPTEQYPPGQVIDDVTQYVRAKYLPDTLPDPKS